MTPLFSIMLLAVLPSTDWLSGCWIDAEGQAQEIWSDPVQAHQFGYAYSLDEEGNIAFLELLRIAPQADGRLIYFAYPNGKAPVSFLETERTDDAATFENPNHDFPQRIRYHYQDGKLTAVISTLDGANSLTFEKFRCEAGLGKDAQRQ